MELEDCSEFRFAEEYDIPEIVKLLKLGLGENLMPKSEHYWRWKHLENPFGTSLVLLAQDKGQIIGVRTFMRWRWRFDKQILEAVRGVDTVIHPDYQRNGIFGRLTMALVDTCQERGYHVLFSTPNEKSKKGYMKLGWTEAEKLPVNIKVVRPASLLWNVLSGGHKNLAGMQNESVSDYLNDPTLSKLIMLNNELYGSHIITAHTIQTLRWRYLDVPVAQYYAAGLTEDGELKALVFYRMKATRGGKELRVTDMFLDSHERAKDMKILLKRKIREHRADYVTSGSFGAANIIDGGLALSKRSIGPVVTVHNINMPGLNHFEGFTDWCPSFGDLELF